MLSASVVMDDNNYVFSDSGIGNKNSKCYGNTVLQWGIREGIDADENKWVEDDSVNLGLNENCFHHQDENVEDYASEQEISSYSRSKIGYDNERLNYSQKCISFGHGFNNCDGMPVVSEAEGSGRVYLAGSKSFKNDQQDWSRTRNSLWISEEGSVRRGDIVLKRKWFKVGCFDNEREMFREQLKGRVSRWKVRKISTGSKIFYRCNKFKHFGCGYRMYAEIRGRSRIGLYESGFHDHSSRKFKCLSNFFFPF